jgi:hypothetical protein
MVDVFMALLSFRGFDTPSLPAQGEQRRSTYFNIGRDIPQAGHMDASDLIKALQNILQGGGRPHMASVHV